MEGGRSIQARGIDPDITVRPATLTELEGGPFFSEASLTGHLENGDGDIKPEDRQAPANSEIDRDYQLRSALNLLKGMGILSRKEGASQE